MKKILFAALALALTGAAEAKTYEIDASHSDVSFKIKHLGGKVRGRFDKLSGTFEYEKGKPKESKVEATIEAASINTNHAGRDKHLRNDEFFDVEKCPQITFKSTKVAGKKLHGDLTMHCVTKPVVLDLEIGEEVSDPWKNVKLSASASGTIKRKDFGIEWNKALDKGGFVLGDEVQIEIEIEAAPKKG